MDTANDISSTFGDWHHLLATFDPTAGEVRFYLDGLLDGTAATSQTVIADTAGSLLLGAFSSSGSESFDGNLDDVGIFNEVLTPTEALIVNNLGRDVDLEYDLNQFAQLLDVADGDIPQAVIGDLVWRRTTSTATPAGEIVQAGSDFFINFGNGFSVTTFVPEPSSGTLLLLAGLPWMISRRRRRGVRVAPLK